MDFAPTATPRYRAHYRSGGIDHSVQVRGYRDESQGATEGRSTSVLSALFTALDAILADDFIWTGAFYIPQDSEVSVISTMPATVTGGVSLASLSPQDKITSLGFAGKSSNGSRASLKIFGFNFTTDVTGASTQSDFLILANESADVQNAVDALNALPLAGIDNGAVTWYPRTTVKVNDHWLKQVRRGIIS